MSSRFQLSQRQKELLTGLVIVAVMVGGLGGAEALLRVNQLMTFGTLRTIEKSDRYYIHEETGLRLPVPNSIHGKIEFNSLGFRGPEIQQPKPDGTIRLAFLGHSTTFDPYNLAIESTWPDLVVQQLDKEYRNCRFDYVNAGVPGFSTARIVTYFEHIVSKVEPDVVIVLANDQEIDLEKLATKHGIFDGVHYKPSWLANLSLFWSKVEKNAVIVQRQRAATNDFGKLDVESSDLTSEFAKNLKILTQIAKSSDALPVLVTVSGQLRADQDSAQQIQAAGNSLFFMPYISIEGLLSTRKAYNQAVIASAAATDSLVVDMRNIIPGDAQHFADASHFSAAGSTLTSELVSTALIQEPTFRQLLAERSSGCSL